MKLLVTGATGFIGGALASLLVQRGHDVRALVRPQADFSGLAALGVEIVQGNLLSAESVEKAVGGVEGVFHLAAIYSFTARDAGLIYCTNVGGTQVLLEAARSAGVRRFVLTSTVATLRWPGRGNLADESCVAAMDELPGHYKRSKLLSEQIALTMRTPSFEVVVVNPTAPFGPGDRRPTPTGRIVLEYLRRRWPGYIETGMNVCDVEDIAEGHLAALEKGRSGERYILGGRENLPLSEIYQILGAVTGMKKRTLRVPYGIAYAAGVTDWIIESAILRREPYIPLEGLRVARHPLYVRSDKAVGELGLKQRSAADSLERSARWYIDNLYSRHRRRTPRRFGQGEAT